MLMDYTRCLLASCPHRKLRRANQMSHYVTITQMEGMVLGFVVENNLPFSTAEKIVELENEMMRDPHAAKKLKLA